MNRQKLAVVGAFAAVLAVVLLVPLFRLAGGQQDDLPFPTTTAAAEGPQYRGIWLQLHNNDPDCPFEDYIREIAATGVNAVCLSISAEQENGSSTAIYMDRRRAPSKQRLIGIFDLIKSLNKRIVFMPIILLSRPAGDEWRGKINPDDWHEWWKKYSAYVLEYAALCQANGVSLFIIGSELVSTERFEDRWRKLIEDVRQQSRRILDEQFRRHLQEKFPTYGRQAFRGAFGISDIKTFSYSAERPDRIRPRLARLYRQFEAPRRMLLCYSANWDHYATIKWWDAVDVAGVTSYNNLNPSRAPDPPLEDLLEAWKPAKRQIAAWQRKINKPVFFTEAGWASQDGCSIEPWNYYHSETPDPAEQQRCMQSFLATFAREPWVAGVLIWKWRDDPGMEADKVAISYSPYDKPVMDDLLKFFASPNVPAASRPVVPASGPSEVPASSTGPAQ